MYGDGQGNLWIGTENGGLTLDRDGIFTNYTVRDGLPDNMVLSITGDGQGGVWIGTMRGLARFDEGRITSYATKPGMPKGPVSAICLGNKKRVWLGTYDQGLMLLGLGEATAHTVNDGLSAHSVWVLHENRDGSLWVGGPSGLARLKDGRFSIITANHGQQIQSVKGFAEDRRGTLWIASRTGLFRWDGTKITHFNKQDGLSDTYVRSVFIDREGNLWIGTDTGGLNRWRKSNVVANTAEQGLSNQGAQAILQDHQGTVWIAMERKLFAFRNGVFRAYPSRVGDPFPCPTSLAEDRQGDLWIADCQRRLFSLMDGRLTSYSKLKLPSHGVRIVYADSEGNIWIGTYRDGLYRFRNGTLTNYRSGDGLADNHINCITEDHDGALWLGTSTGISRLKLGRITTYRFPGLSEIRDIYVSAGGTLWIGTYGYGLFRFKDGKFARITSEDGLFDDVVSAILEDHHGNFWMSGNKGIFRIPERELNAFAEGRLAEVTSVSYGIQDGMNVSEANGMGEPSAWRTRDGRLWFAMIRGVVVIDPDAISSVPAPVAIREVTLDGKRLPSGQTVRIRPGQSNLEIHYTALSFSRPHQVKFKYKLVGADRNWADAGTRRTAYFPHLVPGNYTFTVIADNGEGVWNKKGASLAIVVIPPLWRTWWFHSLTMATLLAAGIIAYQLRVARLKSAQAEQETFSRQLLASQEAERQRIAAGNRERPGLEGGGRGWHRRSSAGDDRPVGTGDRLARCRHAGTGRIHRRKDPAPPKPAGQSHLSDDVQRRDASQRGFEPWCERLHYQ